MKKLLIPISLLVLAVALFMGQKITEDSYEKWSNDPRMMKLEPTGEPVSQPVITDNIQRTFTEPQVYNTPAGMMIVNPNIRVHPSNNTQSETPITRHPTNQSILYGSSNAVTTSVSFISEGMYASTNAGVNWFGSDTTAAAPINNHGGDPAPAIGLNGIFINLTLGIQVGYMLLILQTMVLHGQMHGQLHLVRKIKTILLSMMFHPVLMLEEFM